MLQELSEYWGVPKVVPYFLLLNSFRAHVSKVFMDVALTLVGLRSSVTRLGDFFISFWQQIVCTKVPQIFLGYF